jgi:hypothetical protein
MWGVVENTYLGYITEMTQQAHMGVGIGSYYNKMMAEYPPEIESYSNKIKSYN